MPRTLEARSSPRGARLMRGLVLAAVLLGSAETRAAAAIEGPEAVIGQWEMTLDDTGRKCRLALRIESASPTARVVALPYGCRRAFPILADVQGWTLSGDGGVSFLDQAGGKLLGFSVVSAERLAARGPQGEVYRLTSVTALTSIVPTDAKQGVVEPLERAAKPTPRTLVRPSDAAGRYSILREGGKDTGCMLTLDDKTPAKGGTKAFLAPACRDQGIVIFDPVAWRLVNGRLELTARKGHTTHLDLQPDGTWLKDPKEGKSLGLAKL